MPTDSDLDSNLKDSHRCQSGGREVEESGGGGNRLACKHGGAKGVQIGCSLGGTAKAGLFRAPDPRGAAHNMGDRAPAQGKEGGETEGARKKGREGYGASVWRCRSA